jgi:cytochrome c peroxidase
MRNRTLTVALALCALGACKKQSEPSKPAPPASTPPTGGPTTPPAGAAPAGTPYKAEPIAGLYDPPASADNPQTVEKIALGKQLFFDPRLSGDGKASCETCHQHDKGWTDGEAFSVKVGGEKNTRNTPSLYNAVYQEAWYWDGRAPTLEKQIAAAWEKQMGADKAKIAGAIAAVPGYAAQFQKVFGAPPSADNIPQALAAYVRTLRSGGSAWDRYEAGDKKAVSDDAIAGYKIFSGKGQCAVCHMPQLYSDGKFHNVGLEAGKDKPDVGRNKVSNDPKDMSAFKTPSLRSVAKTAPYFHDASAASLEDAVKYMASGGKADPNRDPLLKPANLSDAEIKQVVAFLTALSSDEPLEKPTMP